MLFIIYLLKFIYFIMFNIFVNENFRDKFQIGSKVHRIHTQDLINNRYVRQKVIKYSTQDC